MRAYAWQYLAILFELDLADRRFSESTTHAECKDLLTPSSPRSTSSKDPRTACKGRNRLSKNLTVPKVL